MKMFVPTPGFCDKKHLQGNKTHTESPLIPSQLQWNFVRLFQTTVHAMWRSDNILRNLSYTRLFQDDLSCSPLIANHFLGTRIWPFWLSGNLQEGLRFAQLDKKKLWSSDSDTEINWDQCFNVISYIMLYVKVKRTNENKSYVQSYYSFHPMTLDIVHSKLCVSLCITVWQTQHNGYKSWNK